MPKERKTRAEIKRDRESKALLRKWFWRGLGLLSVAMITATVGELFFHKDVYPLEDGHTLTVHSPLVLSLGYGMELSQFVANIERFDSEYRCGRDIGLSPALQREAESGGETLSYVVGVGGVINVTPQEDPGGAGMYHEAGHACVLVERYLENPLVFEKIDSVGRHKIRVMGFRGGSIIVNDSAVDLLMKEESLFQPLNEGIVDWVARGFSDYKLKDDARLTAVTNFLDKRFAGKIDRREVYELFQRSDMEPIIKIILGLPDDHVLTGEDMRMVIDELWRVWLRQ